jgi:RNA recognition motif-containing protein
MCPWRLPRPKFPEEQIEVNQKMLKNLKILKTPSKMLEFLKQDPEVLMKLALNLANENYISLAIHNIKVREIWVGNLVNETTESDVRAAFSVHGKIETIEMFNKAPQIFAFVKYEKVSQAAKAFENIESLSLSMKLGLRISYSDFTKRNSIVGDSALVTDNLEDLTPFVFMAYGSGINLPKEKILKKKLAEFGKIKSMTLRPSYNNNLKSIILVEMNTLELALRFRKYYFINDTTGKRRSRLGNKEIDINLLTKVMEPRKFEVPKELSASSSLLNSMIKLKLKNKTINEEIQDIFDIPQKERTKGKNTVEEVEESENAFFENERLKKKYDLFWSGIVYRGKKRHFLADGYHVTGDPEVSALLPGSVLLSHKTTIKEALSRKRAATVVFSPACEVGFKEFNSFLEEFQNNDIVGMTYSIKKYVFYLIPYQDRLRELIPELDPFSYVGILSERGENELEDAIKLAVDGDDGACSEMLVEKKETIKRHDSKAVDDVDDSDSDNYSESPNHSESPDES